jgi:hypothetical protein
VVPQIHDGMLVRGCTLSSKGDDLFAYLSVSDGKNVRYFVIKLGTFPEGRLQQEQS